MATAANHRIIIEQGSDFRINLQVSENELTPKDLTSYIAAGAVEMVIKYKDPATGNIVVQDTIAGSFVDDVPAFTDNVVAGSFVIGVTYTITTVGTTDFTLIGALDNNIGTSFVATGVGSGTGTADTLVPASGTYVNGYCEVVIDKAVTATYPTRLDATLDPFTTEYMYNYHIDITEDTATSAGKENLRILRGKCAVRA